MKLRHLLILSFASLLFLSGCASTTCSPTNCYQNYARTTCNGTWKTTDACCVKRTCYEPSCRTACCPPYKITCTNPAIYSTCGRCVSTAEAGYF